MRFGGRLFCVREWTFRFHKRRCPWTSQACVRLDRNDFAACWLEVILAGIALHKAVKHGVYVLWVPSLLFVLQFQLKESDAHSEVTWTWRLFDDVHRSILTSVLTSLAAVRIVWRCQACCWRWSDVFAGLTTCSRVVRPQLTAVYRLWDVRGANRFLFNRIIDSSKNRTQFRMLARYVITVKCVAAWCYCTVRSFVMSARQILFGWWG